MHLSLHTDTTPQAEAVLQPAYGNQTTTAIPPCKTNTHQTKSMQPLKQLST